MFFSSFSIAITSLEEEKLILVLFVRLLDLRLFCIFCFLFVLRLVIVALLGLFSYLFYILRLCLLTVTNPNQMREVLLFVCSKMADETDLSSTLLWQIEQERSEEESYVGDALALAFRWARFCSASLVIFASYSPAPLLMRLWSILCNLFTRLCWYVEVF